MCGKPRKPTDTRLAEAVLYVLSAQEVEIEDLANLALAGVFEICKDIELTGHLMGAWKTALGRLEELGASVGFERLTAAQTALRPAYRELEPA